MTADALLSLVLSRSDHVLWLWCFHVAVSLGLFALVVVAPALRAAPGWHGSKGSERWRRRV